MFQIPSLLCQCLPAQLAPESEIEEKSAKAQKLGSLPMVACLDYVYYHIYYYRIKAHNYIVDRRRVVCGTLLNHSFNVL